LDDVKPGEEMKSNKHVLPVVIGAGLLGILAVTVVCVLAVYLSKKPSMQVEKVNFESAVPVPVYLDAPDLELVDLGGEPVSFDDYVGQVVLVNNWAYWCEPCLAELPTLQAYYDEHKQNGFTVVGIETDGEEESITPIVDLYKLTYPIWLDPNGEAYDSLQSTGLPSSVVLDRKGMVVLKWFGPISREMLEYYITPLLTAPAP
jgi:peroxiredoxin